MLEGFHVANGLFFDRLPSGHVRIRQVSQASGYNKINAPWEDRPVSVVAMIAGDTWESVVREMFVEEESEPEKVENPEPEAEITSVPSKPLTVLNAPVISTAPKNA